MSTDLFAVTKRGEGVVSVQIATDADPYLGRDWVERFTTTLSRLGEDATVRAVVLEGGDRYFSAGASSESLLDASDVGGPASYAARAPHALLALPVPVIAAAAGHAVGGGLLLALWCDAVTLAEQSLYGANFMALGFTPGMGATQAMQESFGAPLGRELLFTGRLLTGREIRRAACPLSHAVRPRAQVLSRAVSLAEEIAAAPREAVALLKQNLADRRREALDRALRAEEVGHRVLFADPSTRREIAHRYAAGPWPTEGKTP